MWVFNLAASPSEPIQFTKSPLALNYSLVFEYVPHTLYSRLRDERSPVTRQETRRYMRHLLRGLRHLHGISIMHRDIKPANLLITDDGTLKIADFGLARVFRKDQPDRCYSPQVATRCYRAPEILWGGSKYGPPIDLWAAGCVLAEMLRGVPLFPGTTDIEQLALVVRVLGTPDPEQWPELTTLADYNKIRYVQWRGARTVQGKRRRFPIKMPLSEDYLVIST